MMSQLDVVNAVQFAGITHTALVVINVWSGSIETVKLTTENMKES